MNFEGDVEFELLFFGMKCCVLFVKVIVIELDFLLLDELMNYLDIDVI